MPDPRARLEAHLGIRLPDGMVEDARMLAEAASARAHAQAATLPAPRDAATTLKEPRDAGGFLAVLESLAEDEAGG